MQGGGVAHPAVPGVVEDDEVRGSGPRRSSTPRRRSSAGPCCRIPSSASSGRTRRWRAGSPRRRLDAPGLLVFQHLAAAPAPFDGAGHRRVDGDRVALDVTTTRSHSTLKGRQRLAGASPFMPTASIQAWLPIRRTITVSPGLKPRGRGDPEAARADRHVVVGDGLRWCRPSRAMPDAPAIARACPGGRRRRGAAGRGRSRCRSGTVPVSPMPSPRRTTPLA